MATCSGLSDLSQPAFRALLRKAIDMALRDLLLSLRDQHEAERRLEREKTERRAAWTAAYSGVVSAFSAALEPLAAEGLLSITAEKQVAKHPIWGDFQASILMFEASGKRAELRPVSEAHPGYAGQALLIREQEGRRAREIKLYLFASDFGPSEWQLRVLDLQGIFTTDVVSRPDLVFAPVDRELIEAALEKVLSS